MRKLGSINMTSLKYLLTRKNNFENGLKDFEDCIYDSKQLRMISLQIDD